MESGGPHSVNEGFGKDLYRKASTLLVKRFKCHSGWLPLESEKCISSLAYFLSENLSSLLFSLSGLAYCAKITLRGTNNLSEYPPYCAL